MTASANVELVRSIYGCGARGHRHAGQDEWGPDGVPIAYVFEFDEGSFRRVTAFLSHAEAHAAVGLSP